MKKIVIITSAFLLFICNSYGTDIPYQANDNKIDELFANAPEVSPTDASAMKLFQQMEAGQISASEPNALVATILAMPWLGVGVLGIHRLYLGTETSTFLAYLFTLGGCGIISLVDFIVLVVGVTQEDISQYVDNPKFIMWGN